MSSIFLCDFAPLRLCAFARGNLYTPAPLTAQDHASNPFNPDEEFFRAKAQKRKVFQTVEMTIFDNKRYIGDSHRG